MLATFIGVSIVQLSQVFSFCWVNTHFCEVELNISLKYELLVFDHIGFMYKKRNCKFYMFN